jgi:hypothetical protein
VYAEPTEERPGLAFVGTEATGDDIDDHGIALDFGRQAFGCSGVGDPDNNCVVAVLSAAVACADDSGNGEEFGTAAFEDVVESICAA